MTSWPLPMSAKRRVHRRGIRLALLPLLFLLAGASFNPATGGDLRLLPSEAYRTWWTATEACAGQRANFDRIEWFLREGFDFVCPTGRCVGRWEPKHRIYIASRWRNHEMVVRHEMLHAILGSGSHPEEIFATRCKLTWETWNR